MPLFYFTRFVGNLRTKKAESCFSLVTSLHTTQRPAEKPVTTGSLGEH